MSLPHQNPAVDEREGLITLTAMGSHRFRRALRVLYHEDVVIELRAFGDGAVLSGYFDLHEALAWYAARLDLLGFEVFVTINKVDPALLGRAHNKIVRNPESTTTDADIVRRTQLFVDVDPVRPSNTCSTAAEKRGAKDRAQDVARYLYRQQGLPHPVVVDSGNGYHLYFPIDLPNNESTKRLVRGTLEALASRFDDESVKVDTAVYNAARIVRLPGSANLKGDSTRERPHRQCKIIKTPDEAN